MLTATGKWVIAPPRKTLVVGVADMVVSNDASAELVTYSLGSCLGVTAYDPAQRIGGLLHLMLPDSTIDAAKAASAPWMFVDTGIPHLFRAVCNLGADRKRLIVKVAGGAQLLDPQGVFNIGERNHRALKALLAKNGYRIHGEDVGGHASRTVRLYMTTGSFYIKSPGVEIFYL
jgi:chemotaxis protein CheD